MLPRPTLRAHAGLEDSPSRTRSCWTQEQTDPRLDARLTQHHRRGTSDRERRIYEQQEEQEATQEQRRRVGTEAKTHCVPRPLQVQGCGFSALGSCLGRGGGDALNPTARRRPQSPGQSGSTFPKRPANRNSPPGTSLPFGARRLAPADPLPASWTSLLAERIDRSELSLASEFSVPDQSDPARRCWIPRRLLGIQNPRGAAFTPIPGASLPWDLERAGLSEDSWSSAQRC